MKLTKTASGKTIVKMSRAEWTNMGKKAGWLNDTGLDRVEEPVKSINDFAQALSGCAPAIRNYLNPNGPHFDPQLSSIWDSSIDFDIKVEKAKQYLESKK
jgi:hypothetical protein